MLATRWEADGFGRATRELHEDGNEIQHFVKQCKTGCPSGAAIVTIADYFNAATRTGAPSVSYVDTAGHALRTQTWGFDGRQIVTDQRYDALGQLFEVDQPRFLSVAPVLAKRFDYDILGRTKTAWAPDESGTLFSTTTQFQGWVTTNTNANGKKRIDTHDALGRVVDVVDATGGHARFTYDAFGSLTGTIDPNANVITVGYDALGRKTSLNDPDLGLIAYSVDAAGHTWQQVSPVQRKNALAWSKPYTRMEFDKLDRMTARYEPDLESHWIYDTAANGIGQLAEAYTGPAQTKDYQRLHTYEAQGRPATITQKLYDATYLNQIDYDAFGRVAHQTWRRGNDVGGSAYYHEWAESYYEKIIDVKTLQEVFDSLSVSQEQLAILNPELTIDDLSKDLEEILGS